MHQSLRNRHYSLAMGAALLLALSGCHGTSPGSSTTDSSSTKGTTTTPSVAAAPASTLDPNLANPQVDDVWAAELSHFSRASFNIPQVNNAPGKAFGLMRIIRVNDRDVTAITEQGAWPEARKSGSLDDLHGDYHDIRWDPSEEITVSRAEFAALVAANQILETRRGAPVQAASSGNASAPAGAASTSDVKPAAPANGGK